MYYLYQIKNKITSYKYIGCSKNIDKRWREHERSLSKNKHHCLHLQRAWNKYGAELFEFEILQEFSSEDHMFISERELISSATDLYNTALGGIGGDLSKNRSIEQKLETSRKKSESARLRYQRPGEREKCNAFKDLTEEERLIRIQKWKEVKTGRNNKSFKNTRPVKQISKETGEIVKIWEDSWSARYYEGFSSEYIVKCCNKSPKYKSHKGFLWEWAD